jgi:hypothetical protein
MIIISHRGNLSGPEPESENSPGRIRYVLKQGFDVEIDLWVVNGRSYLGHEYPQYIIDNEFLSDIRGLWVHCKNRDALYLAMSIPGLRYFWHESDEYTMTSQGIVWVHVGIKPIKGSICVMPKDDEDVSMCYGICTDYPLKYAKNYTNIK